MLTNCDYAVECGKKLNLKLVGIGGKYQNPMDLKESTGFSKNVHVTLCAGSDLKEGHQMFTLAFVWQLMRAYTLSLLAKLSTDGKPVTEAQIIQWANKKVFLLQRSKSKVLI